MAVSSSVYTKHLVRSVPQRGAVPVHLLVGEEQKRLDVARPMDFNDITLLSGSACSKRTDDLGALGPRTLAKRSISRWGRPIEAGYFFDTRYKEPNNISHLLMDIIPLCLCVKAAVPDAKFIFRPLEPRFRELLEHFGIQPISTYRPVSGQQLSFRLSRGLSQYEIKGSFDAPVYSYTGEVYGDYIEERTGPSKIFVSRRGPRSPVNADELNAFLENRGFRIVYLEDHPIAEQIALMQGADEVVAIHGAAIAYLALKNRTRTFVELMPPHVYHDHFAIGIGHKVSNFFQLIPSFDDDVQFDGWSAIFGHKQQPFSVDLTQLGVALDS